jgi:hypothetical protein
MRNIFSPNLFRPAVSILTHGVVSVQNPLLSPSVHLPTSHNDIACIEIDDDGPPTVPQPPPQNTSTLYLAMGCLIDYLFWRVEPTGLPHPPLITNMGYDRLSNLLGLPNQRWNPKGMGATIYLSPLKNNRKKSKYVRFMWYSCADPS